jgi:hypothetical protein
MRSAVGCALGAVYGMQELHELVTDLGRGFVLYPVAHFFDFEIPHETGKGGAEFFDGWIEHSQAIRLPRNEKGRLRDLRAFPSTGQIEISFRSAVVIQATVKAGTLKFSDVMSDVIWFHPWGNGPGAGGAMRPLLQKLARALGGCEKSSGELSGAVSL